jgi:hypothetical protein
METLSAVQMVAVMAAERGLMRAGSMVAYWVDKMVAQKGKMLGVWLAVSKGSSLAVQMEKN